MTKPAALTFDPDNRVQPGYLLRGTRQMGDYYGIRQKDELVAITGERMRMNGLSEISAVVTHPEFTGRKFAQQLVAYTVKKILTRILFLFYMWRNRIKGPLAFISGLAFRNEGQLIFGK